MPTASVTALGWCLVVGLVLLLVQAVDLNASATAITSYSLYGGSMILLFLASTLYHAIPHQRQNVAEEI